MMTTTVVGLYLAANMRETHRFAFVHWASVPPANACRSGEYQLSGFPNVWRERYHVTHPINPGGPCVFETEIEYTGIVWNSAIGLLGVFCFAVVVELFPKGLVGYIRFKQEQAELDKLLAQ